MLNKTPYLLLVLLAGLCSACSTSDNAQPQPQATLVGSWKFSSFVVTHCTDAGNNQAVECTALAADCGVLTFTENTWSWVQNMPDGSQLVESGSFTLSSNYIILTGSSSPGVKDYSISGSVYSYTSTTLTFINSSNDTGCTYTQTYTRYLQPFTPFG
ncbi:MAG: hypothetical protein JNL40_02870 [Cyclobacteriaceae bacterium]|nr:hypothetical protein [Cyclobacteriaceae bacterium]